MNESPFKPWQFIFSAIFASGPTWLFGAIWSWSYPVWVYIPVWIFFFVMAFGTAVGTSITLRGAAAQIEMNERQKADTPGVSEQHPPPVAAEKQETPAGDQKLKRRGDVPSAPPHSDNWTN